MPVLNQFKPGPEPGSTFGKLTVIKSGEPVKDGNQRASTSVCSCACGNVVIIRDYVLRRINTKSCGCTRAHGHGRRGSNKSRTYSLWQNMLTRCRRDKRYVNIEVCAAWRTSYPQFLADMGECPPGLSLDRINNLGNYEPGNCRWANMKEQNNNRRSNRLITYDGKTQTVSQWMNQHGMDYSSFYRRLALGWDESSAAGLPKGSKSRASIDLSAGAAYRLRVPLDGVAKVRISY